MIEVIVVEPDRLRPLRSAVLRADAGSGPAVFPGDDDPQTLHLAAVAADAPRGQARVGGEGVVGGVTVVPEAGHGLNFRLRGMAVAAGWRGRGVGAALLTAVENALKQRGVAGVWCLARLPAVGFYARHGWVRVGEAFDVPPHGPHVAMTRRFSA